MKLPIHESDIPFQTWYEGTSRQIRGKPLCDVGGRSKLGVGLMELPPGSNTLPAHWHSREEEHLYVVSGSATLFLGNRQFPLVQGSYVCFPARQPDAHYLENTGVEPFVYLMIGERIADDRVTYPASAD